MEKTSTFDEQLLSEDEREQVEFMWDLIPAQDRKGMTKSDIVFVLDSMDDFLESQGLLHVDDKTGEVLYEEGDIDETEQLSYIQQAVKDANLALSDSQIQIILDAEYQFGVEQGYYEDED